MERHKKLQHLKSDSDSSESDDDRRRQNVFNRASAHRRQSSDTTHDRSPNRDGEARHRRHRRSDSDDDVEDLPARFDSQGRPLDGGSRGSRSRLTTRSGEFHRPAPHPGGLNIHGGWQIGGTDPEQIERLVRNVTGALEGRRSWVSVIGDVLGGTDLLGPLGPLAGVIQQQGGGGDGGGGESEGHGRRAIEDDDGERRHKRRR